MWAEEHRGPPWALDLYLQQALKLYGPKIHLEEPNGPPWQQRLAEMGPKSMAQQGSTWYVWA